LWERKVKSQRILGLELEIIYINFIVVTDRKFYKELNITNYMKNKSEPWYKQIIKEVVVPATFGSMIAFETIFGTAAALNHLNQAPFDQKYRILWPTYAVNYGISEQKIDEDRDGTLDTKVIVIPRAGIVKQTLK